MYLTTKQRQKVACPAGMFENDAAEQVRTLLGDFDDVLIVVIAASKLTITACS